MKLFFVLLTSHTHTDGSARHAQYNDRLFQRLVNVPSVRCIQPEEGALHCCWLLVCWYLQERK